MTTNSFERYVVRKPVYEVGKGIKNRQSPTMTFMSSNQVPEANYYIEIGWIYDIPQPNPHIHEHVHGYDEIVLHWGGNPDAPQDLGGEIEFYVGGQPITFNTTTAIFLPKGTPHGPLIWKKFHFPHIEMACMLGTGDFKKAWGSSGIGDSKDVLPEKKSGFDYEQYVVRSPLREAGRFFTKGRQAPTMTYMSNLQVPGVNNYIEFGWIWDVVEPGIKEMTHQDYGEIVLHIGGDPDNPEDLGADMEFHLGGEKLSFNTSYAVYIPKGLHHGPLVWYEVRKPHIEMAIMLGAGSFEQGWGSKDLVESKYSGI